MAGITQIKGLSKPAIRGLVEAYVEQVDFTVADRFMPNAPTYSTDFAYDVIKTSQNIAPMIAFGSEPPVMDRDAVGKQIGSLTKFGIKYIATEEELLQLNNPRTDQEHAALVARLQKKAIDISDSILKSIQVFKYQALSTGQLNYDANGVKVALDYGIAAPTVLNGTNKWGASAAKPLENLITWTEDYEKANGKAPDAILMSRESYAKLAKDAAIIAHVTTSPGVSRVSNAQLDSVLSDFGIAPITVVKSRKIGNKDIYSGETKEVEVFPENRVVLLAEGAAEFLLGPTVENNFNPGIFVDSYDKNEPIESILRGVASGIPTIKQPTALFFADVA